MARDTALRRDGFDTRRALRGFIGGLPLVGDLARAMCGRFSRFSGVQSYWEGRYAGGGNSGAGSYGKFAAFKADIINRFAREHEVASVIEFGCGDGNQLSLLDLPRYLGVDVSSTAVARCTELFAGDTTKQFMLASAYDGEQAELSLSLDVIYHLVDDAIFEAYMRDLFAAATRFVVIYSDDGEYVPKVAMPHVRHRQFTAWIGQNIEGWALREKVANIYPYKGNNATGSFADFYIYERVA